MEIYSILFSNNSSQSTNVCICAECTDKSGDLFQIIWLSKYLESNQKVKINWKLNYTFIWIQNGDFETNIIKPIDEKANYSTYQIVPANISTNNYTTLNYLNEKNIFSFSATTQDTNEQSLIIQQAGSVPPNIGLAGFGIEENTIFMANTQPNRKLYLTPDENQKYIITFGDYQTGQKAPDKFINSTAEISFGNGIYSKHADLTENNTWVITNNI